MAKYDEQAEIRKERQKLIELLKPLRRQIAGIEGQLKALQWQCTHPKAIHSKDYDGGTSSSCPDCGAVY